MAEISATDEEGRVAWGGVVHKLMKKFPEVVERYDNGNNSNKKYFKALDDVLGAVDEGLEVETS